MRSTINILNIRYQRYIGWQNYILDIGWIYRDMIQYWTSNRTSYQLKNIHVIAYINRMELLKISLGSWAHRGYLPFIEAPQMHL